MPAWMNENDHQITLQTLTLAQLPDPYQNFQPSGPMSETKYLKCFPIFSVFAVVFANAMHVYEKEKSNMHRDVVQNLI